MLQKELYLAYYIIGYMYKNFRELYTSGNVRHGWYGLSDKMYVFLIFLSKYWCCIAITTFRDFRLYHIHTRLQVLICEANNDTTIIIYGGFKVVKIDVRNNFSDLFN